MAKKNRPLYDPELYLRDKRAAKVNKALMKSPGAGRVAVKPFKKTIRPATSAKKGSK